MNTPCRHQRHRLGIPPALWLALLITILGVGQLAHAEKEAFTPKLLSLSLHPQAVTLRGQGSSQQFLLTGTYSNGMKQDFSRQGLFSLSNPRLARVNSRGQVFLLADGKVRLTATFGGLSVASTITAQASAKTRDPSFALDLEGIFTRQGCNDSHCHGSVKGRGGFKLSSQAGNPREDYRWIVRGGTFQIYSPESAGSETSRVRPEAQRHRLPAGADREEPEVTLTDPGRL